MRPRPAVRTVVASLAVVLAGAGVFWSATDGLEAFTAEAARRHAILKDARPVPALSVVASDGRAVGLIDPDGRPVLIEFIYTSCPTICTALGEEFLRIQTAISQKGLKGRVRLLSISFDLARDAPAALAEYGKLHGADPDIWTVARPRSEGELRDVLDVFGVTVVPDGEGELVHNAAIHYVNGRGRLVRIFDLGEVQSVISQIENPT